MVQIISSNNVCYIKLRTLKPTDIEPASSDSSFEPGQRGLPLDPAAEISDKHGNEQIGYAGINVKG